MVFSLFLSTGGSPFSTRLALVRSPTYGAWFVFELYGPRFPPYADPSALGLRTWIVPAFDPGQTAVPSVASGLLSHLDHGTINGASSNLVPLQMAGLVGKGVAFAVGKCIF